MPSRLCRIPGICSSGRSDVNLCRWPRGIFASLERHATLDTLLKRPNLKNWIKTLGFWGFLFFLVKGLLWLTIPALIAFFAN
jgi:hypothetical protein